MSLKISCRQQFASTALTGRELPPNSTPANTPDAMAHGKFPGTLRLHAPRIPESQKAKHWPHRTPHGHLALGHGGWPTPRRAQRQIRFDKPDAGEGLPACAPTRDSFYANRTAAGPTVVSPHQRHLRRPIRAWIAARQLRQGNDGC